MTSESDNEKPLIKGHHRRKHYDLTSSLNNYYMCNECGRQFKSRTVIYKHVKGCEGSKERDLKCDWCNITFAHRGNLARHALYLHGDPSYKKKNQNYTSHKCDICQKTFNKEHLLRYHIRRLHFNLKATVPYAEMKKVNQVWFEKVLNSNTIIEIKKTGPNTLVMKRLGENTAIKVNSENQKVVDLSDVYPTNDITPKVQCLYCKKLYVKRDLKKHIDEVHLNKRKLSCNNCLRSFKRNYHFIKHVCSKIRRTRGVKSCADSDVCIANVKSLIAPL